MKQLLAFIMFSTIICWMMFSPLYKHVLIMRQALLQQEVDYLLEVGASGQYGYISPAMIEGSKNRLSSFGLAKEKIAYEVMTADGRPLGDISERVMRGDGIKVIVSYPYERLTTIDALVGITPIPEDAKMKAFGVRMSEYVE